MRKHTERLCRGIGLLFVFMLILGAAYTFSNSILMLFQAAINFLIVHTGKVGTAFIMTFIICGLCYIGGYLVPEDNKYTLRM